MKQSIIRIFAAALAAASSGAWADHPSFGFGGASGGINTTSAETLPQGKWAFQSRVEFIDNDAFSDGELENFDALGIADVHSTDNVSSIGLGVAYGITDDTLISFFIPYIRRNTIRAAEPLTTVLGDAAGIGDAIVQVQHKVSTSAGRSISLFAGVKLPTGKTTENTNEGIVQELEFQPGSGSWDPLAGIAVTWHRGKLAIDGSFSYIYATTGKQHTDLGDILDYDLSFAYRLTENHTHAPSAAPHTDRYWDVMLELNSESRKKTRVDGIKGEHEGGTIVYLSPGIKYSTSTGFAAYLSIGIPVLTELNGRQSEPDYRVIAGVNWAY